MIDISYKAPFSNTNSPCYTNNLTKTTFAHVSSNVTITPYLHADVYTHTIHCRRNAWSAEACEKACPKRKVLSLALNPEPRPSGVIIKSEVFLDCAS